MWRNSSRLGVARRWKTVEVPKVLLDDKIVTRGKTTKVQGKAEKLMRMEAQVKRVMIKKKTELEQYQDRLGEEKEEEEVGPAKRFVKITTVTKKKTMVNALHATTALLEYPEASEKVTRLTIETKSGKLPKFISSKITPQLLSRRRSITQVNPSSLLSTNFWEQLASLPTATNPVKLLEEPKNKVVSPTLLRGDDAPSTTEGGKEEVVATPPTYPPYKPNIYSGKLYLVTDRFSGKHGWGVQHWGGARQEQYSVAMFEWDVDRMIVPDEWYWRKKIEMAYELRVANVNFETNSGYRLVNGMGDFIPGVICDIYGVVAVVVLDDPAAGTYPALKNFLVKLGMTHILLTDASNRNFIQSAPLRIPDAPENSHVLLPSRHWDLGGVASARFTENGVQYTWTPDLVEHTFTGHYFKHRTMRQLLATVAGGKSVLDLFAGTGGYGVAAFAAGAAKVHFVESDPGYCSMIGKNLSLLTSEEEWGKHCRIEEGIVHNIKTLTRYEIVVLDPPDVSMDPERLAAETATTAQYNYYLHVFSLATRRVKRGGKIFLTLSNTNIDFAVLCTLLVRKAQQNNLSLSIIRSSTMPADHPTDATMKQPGYHGLVMQVY